MTAEERLGATRTITGRSRFSLEPRWRLSLPAQSAAARTPLIVALHGMGQSGDRLAEVLEPLTRGARAIIFPDGPLPLEVTEDDARREGHAWYIYTGDQDAFLASSRRTAAWLDDLIDATVRTHDLDPHRIVLFGYSQGGYQAGLMLLARPSRYAGLISACSRIKTELLDREPIPDGVRPPVLVLHGEKDRFLPIAAARDAAAALAHHGFDVDFRPFPSGHRFTPEQVLAVDRWLAERGC